MLIITVIAPILSLVVGVGTVFIIFAGSKLFSLNLANAGDVTAFTIYMAQILFSLIMITNVFNMFVRTKASTSRIQEIFQCEGDYPKSGESRSIKGNITFENVTFTYPGGGEFPAIKELSFSVKEGESLAIIGPTGSGKSTIAWLLLHFYDADCGRILLDQYDVKNLGVDEVRNQIAIVPQKPVLFSGSVEENLLWGDENAEKDELKQVIEDAKAEFILHMQEGIESLLGSGGVNLSGGQKQRISIARGILKKSPILILDDATSALDAVTEAKVHDNLKRRTKNRQTIITITQRCGTAMFADKILVMENGNKVGFGSHEELMNSCEVYQDIYRTHIEIIREA